MPPETGANAFGPLSPGSPLVRIRRLAWLLDNSIPIPGTRWRIGLDPLIGLVPGLGDFLGTALSAWILVEGDRMGAGRPTLLRMSWNLLVELVIGTVPILGDIFDAGWKANAKNVALLERHLATPGIQRRRDRVFLAVVITGLAGGAVVAAGAALFLLRWIIHLFQA
jgi:hypothetical protein